MVTAHKSSVMLLSLFLQVVEVVRYLLFSDRKKYPIKRGGMCALRYHKEKCTMGCSRKKSAHPRRMGFWKFWWEGGQRPWKSRQEVGGKAKLEKVFCRGHFNQ